MHLLFEDTSEQPPPKAYPVNPEEGIRFLVRGTLFSECPVTGNIEQRPTITIFGQPNSRQNLYVSHEYLMVHIRFMPGGLFKLLRIPMNELVHQNLDAELILGREIREVQEQLEEAKSYDSMVRIFNNYFQKKSDNLKITSSQLIELVK